MRYHRLLTHALLALATLGVGLGCSAQTAPTPPLAQTQVGTVTRARLAGSLEPRQNLGCIRIDDTQPSYTAADLYAAVPDCVKAERYEDAKFLYYLAGMTLRFDTLRVADPSAGAARQVLLQRMHAAFPLAQSQKAVEVISAGSKDAKTLATLCETADRLGPPSYFPEYLVLHGLAAYGKADPLKDALVPNFDAAATWRELKIKYLHCAPA